MNKNLKILIIGFGSIGARHFKNLESLGYTNVYVYDSLPEKIKDKKLKIENLDKKNLEGLDVAFICNPNHKHVETAIKCAEAGLHLFIEKPLSHNLKGINKLQKIVEKKKLVNMVACNMRFFESLQVIKNFLSEQKLGRVYSINLQFGQYLPFWRPGTDYRQNYAAKKEMGGGIVLDDIHEFDLLFWLNDFSLVKKSCLFKNHASDLEIETEDQAKAVFQFKNGVSGSVASDYLSKKYHRTCRIVGEKGNLSWDWNENIVWFENEKGRKKILSVKNYDLNEMYLDEVKYFLKCVEVKKETFNTVKKAKEVLRHLL